MVSSLSEEHIIKHVLQFKVGERKMFPLQSGMDSVKVRETWSGEKTEETYLFQAFISAHWPLVAQTLQETLVIAGNDSKFWWVRPSGLMGVLKPTFSGFVVLPCGHLVQDKFLQDRAAKEWDDQSVSTQKANISGR